MIYYFVKSVEKLNATDKLLLGRLLKLKDEDSFLMYSVKNAERDFFSKRSYIRSIQKLKQLEIISTARSRQCTIIQFIKDLTSYVILDCPDFLCQKLSAVDIAVYGRLNYFKSNDYDLLSNSQLVKDLSFTPVTICRSIKSLQEKNLIKINSELKNGFNIRTFVIENLNKNECQKDNGLCQIDNSIKCQKDNCEVPNRYVESAKKIFPSSINKNINRNINLVSSNKSLSTPPSKNISKNKSENSNKNLIHPKSPEQIIEFFNQYIEKHIKEKPFLSNLNIRDEASAFYDYYDSNNWHDNRGNKVDMRNIKLRINQWVQHWIKFKNNFKPKNKAIDNTNRKFTRVPSLLSKDREEIKVRNAIDLGDVTND